MQKSLLLFLMIGLLVLCFSQGKPGTDRAAQLQTYKAAAAIYEQAEKQSAQAGNNETLLIKADELYQRSLLAFDRILPEIEKTTNDSLLFHIKIRTGFIHYYFGDAVKAKTDYLSAFVTKKKLSGFPDSLLFLPCLFTGGIYYDQNQFDSALYYYKEAEQINDANGKALDNSERLYNRLGAMYYEMGNYQQARNYFQKAITQTNPADKELLANYQINIASLLIKLEEFGTAKTIFEGVLPSTVFQNEIYHNLGIISQKEKNYQEAVRYFRKVRYVDNKRQVDLLYNFALAYAALEKEDSAAFYTDKALAENRKWFTQRKSIQHGLILAFQGDQALKKSAYKEAISFYQQAIIQFHYLYNDTAILDNPRHFNGVYSFIHLFNTLVAKADALEKWWQQEKDIKLLEASLQTYQSAFDLANYVERTYNSDEARLFLGKIKYTVHSKPIDMGLKLYELTKQQQWLESVYVFDQQNKASALALAIQENELRLQNEAPTDLLKKEASLKSIITRLLLKAGNMPNADEQNALNTDIREKEIELNKIQEKINEEPGWAQKRSVRQIPSVEQLQKKLDKQTVLFSYHLSGTELVTLFISSNSFVCKKISLDRSFFIAILGLKNSLYNSAPGQRYDGLSNASSLYEKLIGP
ncbi:MAG TPA: tetratricopeptide repeat protein, partial [Chitinophagaceae bacterium]|nr:tetratricopeptide repeat protein [Chitinophagaceae bacterium]